MRFVLDVQSPKNSVSEAIEPGSELLVEVLFDSTISQNPVFLPASLFTKLDSHRYISLLSIYDSRKVVKVEKGIKYLASGEKISLKEIKKYGPSKKKKWREEAF